MSSEARTVAILREPGYAEKAVPVLDNQKTKLSRNAPIPKKADDVPGFPGILENRSSSLEFLFFVGANVRSELARDGAAVKIETTCIGSEERL
jgi:hypothetical protein